MYDVQEVDGVVFSEAIHGFNSLVPEWPRLSMAHLENGFWWLAYHDEIPVGFAGVVPFTPFEDDGVWYFKRCYIAPAHHGHGLQYRMMIARELKAKQLGWKKLVSDCDESNTYSARNFRLSGFTQVFPEQPWAPRSMFWVKKL